MDWETFDSLSAVEQGRDVIKALETSMGLLLEKMISNINVITLFFSF